MDYSCTVLVFKYLTYFHSFAVCPALSVNCFYNIDAEIIIPTYSLSLGIQFVEKFQILVILMTFNSTLKYQ